MKTLWCVHSAPTIVCDVCISSAQYQIFGVFDGHGGERAADFAKANIPQFVSEELTTDAFDPYDCLIRAFQRTDQQFIEACDVRNST